MVRTAASLIVRAIHKREGTRALSLKGQRCSFSSSSIRREAGTTPVKRIPVVNEWDGIVISPYGMRGKKTRFRPDPTTPIQNESEFKKNTLSRELAAQRLETRRDRTQKDTSAKNDENGKISKYSDIGPIRRRQDRKAETVDAAGAALQNFQGSQWPSKDRHATKATNPTTRANQNDKSPSTVKVSRRRNPERLDKESDANISFSASSSWKSTPALVEIFDGDNFAVSTPLPLRNQDLDTAPKEEQLPDSLTVLHPQFFLDADLDDQVERQIGRYDAYFSAQIWELADKARDGKTSSPVEYASLTVAHNATLDPEKKKKSMTAIKQFLESREQQHVL